MDTPRTKHNLVVIDSALFRKDPDRYELRPGNTEGAPLCPYGNQYEWIGFDLKNNSFVRFTKSVFKSVLHRQRLS